MTTTQQPEALNLEEFRAKVTRAAREPLLARIAELEAQLSAIGSGGVEPLRKRAATAYPTEGVPEQAGTYAEARECEHCNHVGINDSAEGVATCVACQWIGDSPKEDKCPDCEAEGTMTASCPKCHHEYRLIADATLAATQPAAQGLDAETQRHAAIGKAIERACADLPEETEIIVSLEKDAGTVTLIDQDGNEHENFSCDYGFAGVLNEAIDAAIAAQAKQGGQANG